MQAWGFLKNRAMVASLGAVLIFGIGSAAAVSQLTHHATPAGQANTANAAATDTTTTGAAATDTSTTGAGSGANPTATAIPPTPTTQQPTPTNVPVGQADKTGAIAAQPSSTSFPLRLSSGTVITIKLGPNTHYQGAATTLTQLQNNWQAGWTAEVQGTWQADGSILALDVNSHTTDN